MVASDLASDSKTITAKASDNPVNSDLGLSSLLFHALHVARKSSLFALPTMMVSEEVTVRGGCNYADSRAKGSKELHSNAQFI